MEGTAADARPRRFETWWVVVGLLWGAIVGLAWVLGQMLLPVVSDGRTSDVDQVGMLWLVAFGTAGATYGGVAGTVVGVVVVLVLGQDPEVRAARRIPATLLLVLGPPVALALWLYV